MNLLKTNSKLKKSSDKEYRLVQWSIPAYQIRRGKYEGHITCPMAGTCGKGGCYAQQGSFVWTNVNEAHTRNYELSLSKDFENTMAASIESHRKIALKNGQQLVVRIHDSGDFYSLKYAMKWFYIALKFPKVRFYAYTKMVKMFQTIDSYKGIPSNLTIIYSEGGKQDTRINPASDRHSRVFSSAQELADAGYDNASSDDKVAFLSTSGKIGLVYHGAKSKAWNTDSKQ